MSSLFFIFFQKKPFFLRFFDMGKGQIISGGTDGNYQVKLLLDRRRVNSEQFGLTRRIAAVAAEAAAMDAGTEKDKKLLQGTALAKREDLIQADMPADPTVAAWCADFTEDLSGIVGTVEVPGERGTVLIQPGYDGNAAYDSDRDGVLQPSPGGTPESVYFNWALRPGWQKWWPTYRFGVITSITDDACDLRLYTAQSSDQGLNLNQATTLSNVSIEYMDCNGAAFSKGDHVLVKFEGQQWASPKVVGFKDNPVACTTSFYIRLTIDSNTLYYGGQQISITYTKRDTSEATTAAKSIHGGGASPDSQLHYLAGPFDLEEWNQGNIYINLQRNRDTGAMSSVPSETVEVNPIAGCGGGPYYTKSYPGMDKMFDYFVEDLVSPEFRVFTYQGTWTEILARPILRCSDEVSQGALEWTLHYERIGLTSDTDAPASGYSYGTLKYRRLNQIRELISAANVLLGASSETVYNWDTTEYETADVWELNINFGLKQAHYLWWHDDRNDARNPYTVCGNYGCGGIGTMGHFPASSPSLRYKYEVWNNDIETTDPPDSGSMILSIPYMTFNFSGYVDGYFMSGNTWNCYAEWTGGWVYDAYPGADADCFGGVNRYNVAYADWTQFASFVTGTPPILVVVSEENYAPSQALALNGNLRRGNREERYYYISAAPDCEEIDDPDCDAVADEEIAQLCEMVATQSYWY
jgi:hypothetical protein